MDVKKSMLLEQAWNSLQPIIGKRFRDLFQDLPDDLIKNKGHTGQLLLHKIGLPLDTKLTDFEDGELKTNKSDEFGNPLETMFITQISTQIDNLLANPPQKFEESNLYKKIRRLIFLPICKSAPINEDWFFVSVHLVDLDSDRNLKSQLEEDYYTICDQLRKSVVNSLDGFIHTSNGKFLQVRSKDGKPYNPIYSEEFGRYISNKNHAFYFKKEFMRYVRS